MAKKKKDDVLPQGVTAPATITEIAAPLTSDVQIPSTVPPIPVPPAPLAGQPKPPSEVELFTAILDSLGAQGTEEKSKRRDEILRQYLQGVISGHQVARDYNILIIHDESQMVKQDADRIYSAVTAFADKKPVLLVLYSSGGSIGSAYLIGKLCREHSENKFVVVVPRQAKSAATLLCCAADEIHMGALSELGPIDPQIDGLPALGLKHAVEHLADLVKQNPAASEMFARYLSYSLKPVHLGYYERVAQSATQYAEKLLALHADALSQSPKSIAQDLVYTYKDHGFILEKGEAERIFGSKVVKTGSPEYALGNAIYQVLSSVSEAAGFVNNAFYLIGQPSSKGVFYKKKGT